MVTKNILQELVKSYNREGTWAKLEALYIFARSFDFDDARRNIKIRYGTDTPVEDVKSDIDRLCEGIYRTEDTNESIYDIIAKACEQSFPEILTKKVKESIPSLSNIAKRFVFLLYKEGSILNGRISTIDETVLDHFTPAYEIIFGKLGEDKYKIREKALREMIAAGLVYEHYWRSRRHDYYTLIVPPFSKEVWSNLPNIMPLPVIDVKEVW